MARSIYEGPGYLLYYCTYSLPELLVYRTVHTPAHTLFLLRRGDWAFGRDETSMVRRAMEHGAWWHKLQARNGLPSSVKRACLRCVAGGGASRYLAT